MEPTHILEVHTMAKGMDVTSVERQRVLIRCCDGMVLGEQAGRTVIFGDDINRRKSHVFHTEDQAVVWLKSLAQRDIDGTLPARSEAGIFQQPSFISVYGGPEKTAVVDERAASASPIIAPAGAIDLPNDRVRKM